MAAGVAAGNGAMFVSTTLPAARVRTGFVIPLRITSVVLILTFLVQPITAGLFVTGRVGMLTLHDLGATVAFAVVFIQLIAAILYRWPGGGSPRLIVGSVVMIVLITAQMYFGYTRALYIHFPLGVLLLTGAVQQAIAIWRPARTGGEA